MKRISPKVFALIFVICFLAAIPFGIKAVHDKYAPASTPVSAEQTPATAPTPSLTPTPEAHPVKAFTEVDTSYFDDALFIGDSRTVGLQEYGTLSNACWFANVGMSVYSVQSARIAVPELGTVSLETLLKQKTFGKIYLMLGVNELGYDFGTTVAKYQELVEKIRASQPDATLFIEANLHLAQQRSSTDSIVNNTNIDRFNAEIANLADQRTVFYIDINELFDDENGNLRSDYTSDSTHIYAKYYQAWCDWLCTKGIV